MTLYKARIVFLCLPASGSSSTGKHSELQSQLRRPTKKSTQLWRSRSTGHPPSHLTNAETRGDTPLTVRYNTLTSHNNGSMNYEITQVIAIMIVCRKLQPALTVGRSRCEEVLLTDAGWRSLQNGKRLLGHWSYHETTYPRCWKWIWACFQSIGWNWL